MQISSEETKKTIDKIIAEQPKFEGIFELDRLLSPISIFDLDNEDWERLFRAFPSLVDDIRGEWIGPFAVVKVLRGNELDSQYRRDLESKYWADIFQKRPDLFPFGHDCPNAWIAAIAVGIRKAEDCNCLKQFDVNDWLYILENRPKLANANLQYPSFWAAVLALCPERENECPVINRLKRKDWIVLFARQPQFADKYKKLKNFDTYSWAELLAGNPSFAKRCRKWERLGLMDWGHLLHHRQEFAERAKRYINGWLAILSDNPEMVSQCDKLADFSQEDWEYLYSCVDNFPTEYLFKYIPNLETISDRTWGNIIIYNPKLIETAKNYKNGWIALLESDPERYENEFPYWGKLGDGLENAICITNKLYHRIKWEKIGLDIWINILNYESDKSELIAHCPWNKFEREHWSRIPPKFADKCKFPDIREKLNKNKDKQTLSDMLRSIKIH